MKDKKLSLTTQALIMVSVILLVVNVVLGGVLMEQSRTAIKTLLEERMLDIANSAADMVNGDDLKTLTAEDVGTPRYQAIYDTLSIFQSNIELEYIYTVLPQPDGTFIFAVDPAPEDPSEFGQLVKYTDALYLASLGTSAVDKEPYQDAWGRFYSAYSPVFDSESKVAGIVAVDFSADWYDRQLGKSARTVLTGCLLSLCMGALIVFLITEKYRKRFRMLGTELASLAADVDDLTRELRADGAPEEERSQSGDEIAELGRRIRSMRSELGRYIEQSRSQANSMITALASDYRSVYYVDLDADEGICYRAHSKMDNGLREGERFAFRAAFADYAEQFVAEGFREAFLQFVDPANIRKSLENESIIAHRYLVLRDGQESYEMLRMAGVRHPEDRTDHMIHAVGVGFTDVDRETREAFAQSQALSDALALAEEANKAKTAFLSSMSHEIRTPMNAIIGLDSIALNDPDISQKTRDYLEKIDGAARHLLSLINDILDMSRIESGRMVIRSEEFSFPQLLEQINTMVGSQCRDKGLDYRCDVGGQLCDFYIGDDMKLKQVLINILGNAVKFTPEGGKVRLCVEPAARYDGKSTLRFVISDTGIGMDKEFLPRIFEAFSQEDSSTTSKYGSTGLGMAITKNIVEMMNGGIEVESIKGEGTTFTVTVTLLDSERSAAENDDEGLAPQGLSVLVIDDDPIACEHARLVLEHAGVAADTALSGREALEQVRLRSARREAYDLILVDWNMPEMDGVETTRQIRSVLGSESAIVILTAYNWDDVQGEATEAGVDSFLAKPLFAGNVLEAFRQAQRKKRPLAAPRKAELAGRRVLLAEDMPINAEIMQELLSMREIRADHAENGRVAVEYFTASPEGWYDAILMDMRMPEMDGLAATAAIRALDRGDARTVPIIALTANAFDEDVQRSLQAGLNAHLSKPVSPDSLYETLESLIGARGEKKEGGTADV